MITFDDRAIEMGLTVQPARGLYEYGDQYSQVRYRELSTLPGFSEETGNSDETDEYNAGLLAVFTKPAESEINETNDEWLYSGYVSRLYKFIGNEDLVSPIRNSIIEIGMPIVNEVPILSLKKTQFRNEMVIQNGVHAAEHGDIFPVMVAKNTYNGEGAQSVQFGLETNHSGYRHMFAFRLGEMRQVHVAGASTVIASLVENYVQAFSASVVDMVTESFNSTLTENQVFSVLDIIDSIGKKRKDDISVTLNEMKGENQLPSAWQVFLAITRYSSLEPNLNVKSLLENAAESVLVIPSRMLDVLEQLER